LRNEIVQFKLSALIVFSAQRSTKTVFEPRHIIGKIDE